MRPFSKKRKRRRRRRTARRRKLMEYGPTTGCDVSLSRIELGYGSKFTESGGQFFLASYSATFLLYLVSVAW